MRDIGSMGASFTNSHTVKQSAVSTSPTMKIMPQTVENHFGSSDMAQSMEPKVMVAAKKTIPAPLTFCTFTNCAGVVSPASSRSDQRLRNQYRAYQPMK